MAITIDKATMVFLPTDDPNILGVTLEYTKDDLTAKNPVINDWQATWKTTTLLWNKNAAAADFLGAVQAAIAAEKAEGAEQKTIKQALIAATGQCRAVTRADPNAKPIPIQGTTADNPLFVKVVP